MTQTEALNILKTGANVFLTGEPGSGKTYTINTYINYLRRHGIEPAITASTGIASTHIDGMTIHSWSGIGVKDKLSARDLDQIKSNKKKVTNIKLASVLIIDEISMLASHTLQMIDVVCRKIRDNTKPFGGLQVILVGDFFQLPPIIRREVSDREESKQEAIFKEQSKGHFAFNSSVWEKLNLAVCYLSEKHRQADPTFLEFLSAMRRGQVEERHIEILRKRYSKNPNTSVITKLYSHNINVDKINSNELNKISGKAKSFVMESFGPKPLVQSLKRSCLSPEVLELKIGSRVMFTKNDYFRGRFVNGTIGEITGFSNEDAPIVKTKNGDIVFVDKMEWTIQDGQRILAKIVQFPLRLAWAITVHKSQGMSLDFAHMDLSDTFEFGQGYVAISRVRTLEGLSLSGLNKRALEVHPEVLEKDNEFKQASVLTQKRLKEMDNDQLVKIQNDFLVACGGSLEPLSDYADYSPSVKRNKKIKNQKREKRGREIEIKSKKLATHHITKNFILQDLPIEEIGRARHLNSRTIIDHIGWLIERGEIEPEIVLEKIKLDKKRLDKIKDAFQQVLKSDLSKDDLYDRKGRIRLTPVREILGEGYSFDEICLARLFLDF